MAHDTLMDLCKSALMTALMICAPALIIGMVVGLATSFLQTVTSMQEQTLSIVPKMLAVATAMLLAHAGCKVTIYEALPSIGGRTRRLEFGSPDRRFAFDCGPTFFMMPYVLEEIFAAFA